MTNPSSSPTAHPFASRDWIAVLRAYLRRRTDELAAELKGGSFSVCEVYEAVPPEVSAVDRVAVFWAVGPEGLAFEEVERDDVDLKVVADWAVIAPLARIAVRGDARRAQLIKQGLAAGLASGQIRATARRRSPAFMDVVHDDLAELTC